jgi:DNA (cytosine-5)-methyltransferase 1
MVLKVGTDCSGLEAPIQALKKLKVKFSHEWSCEIDPHARKSIKANYNPKIVFEDITKPRKLPDIDLYVCGFPCQTFSMAGERKGFSDPRGTIFYKCLKVLKTKKPKYFILENVKGLVNHDDGNTFKTILNCLQKLKLYNIHHQILNTKDYGIPQNRERIFIVGVRKDVRKKFEFPKKRKLPHNIIHKYVDTSDKSKDILPPYYKKFNVKKFKCVFIEMGFINYIKLDSYQQYSPTLMAKNYMWCRPMGRKANVKEHLKLQGFPLSFKQVVSDAQMKKQIGNSMSVNVLVVLFKQML